MSKLLNRDGVLHEILRTLVRGWGVTAVSSVLEEIISSPESGSRQRVRKREPTQSEEPDAVKFVKAMEPVANEELILRFAEEFDRGQALPKLADIKRLLASHHVRVANLKTRNQAFRFVFPILKGMSEKGLLRLIARARFTGPAQLDEISDAIRGAGSDMRGDSEEEERQPRLLR